MQNIKTIIIKVTQRRTWNPSPPSPVLCPPPTPKHLFSHYIEYPATCTSDQLDARLSNPVSEGPQRLERAAPPACEAAGIFRDAALSRRAAPGFSRWDLSGAPVPGLILRTSTGHMQDVRGAHSRERRCDRWATRRGGERAQRRVLKRKGWKIEQPGGQKTLFYPASRSDSELSLHHPRRAPCHSLSVGIPKGRKIKPSRILKMQIWFWIKYSLKIAH